MAKNDNQNRKSYTEKKTVVIEAVRVTFFNLMLRHIKQQKAYIKTFTTNHSIHHKTVKCV